MTEQRPAKQVFLVTAFGAPGPLGGTPGPVSGQAEHVLAVMGIEGGRQRFEWVGDGPEDSVVNPALVTPLVVEQAIPSPWHPDGSDIATGLVELDAAQLGSGPVDDDIDLLVAELAETRQRPEPQGPTTRNPTAQHTTAQGPEAQDSDAQRQVPDPIDEDPPRDQVS